MTAPRLALLVLVLALAGCGGNDAQPQPRPETVTVGGATAPVTETQSCTNEELGYTVAFPADWFTNDPAAAPPCTYFDPDPVEVPEATEFLDVAVSVSRVDGPVESLIRDDATEVLTEQPAQIGGRNAVRVEGRATGMGLLDEGTRTYRVLVDLGGSRTLVFSTQDMDGVDYDRAAEVLDGIADSLQTA